MRRTVNIALTKKAKATVDRKRYENIDWGVIVLALMFASAFKGWKTNEQMDKV